MRVILARLLALIAIVEGMISIPLRLADTSLFGIEGGGFLVASIPTLLLAIFFILDDMRDNMKKPYT